MDLVYAILVALGTRHIAPAQLMPMVIHPGTAQDLPQVPKDAIAVERWGTR
jgi:hypothetical protein